MNSEPFADYYELLQISPNAEPETVQRVFRILAAKLHPDNPHTGDAEKFLALKKAYEILADPRARVSYDLIYQAEMERPWPVFETAEFFGGVDIEGKRRIAVLCVLYKRRRSDAEKPGTSILDLEKLMAVPREHLMFTIWYLREKGHVRTSDQSDLVITVSGTDFLEMHIPTNRVVSKLLTAVEHPAGQVGPEGPAPVYQ